MLLLSSLDSYHNDVYADENETLTGAVMSAGKNKLCCCVLTYAFGPFVAVVCEPFVAFTRMTINSRVAGSISANCFVN